MRIYGADITARKNTEESLAKAYAEVEERVARRTGELAKSNMNLAQEVLAREKVQRALEIKALALKDHALSSLDFDQLILPGP